MLRTILLMILTLVIGIGAGIFIGYHEFAPKYHYVPTVTPIKNDDLPDQA